ncbi:MAG: SDR family NAD(P)-dependent oxidoreductase, partial [Comamonas sp.]|nr:SDR family NAD(P)-dependent oxidoreductase [Comamonas sp.]
MTGAIARDMEGRVALITGAGAGIGRATALQLAARGAVVAVNDLKAALVEETLDAIIAQGGQAFAVVKNVATREEMTAAVDEAYARHQRLDILVNNAAWVRDPSVSEIMPETVDRMLDIGFKAVLWGIQAAAARMDAERGGTIINVASVAALRSAG